MAGTFIPPNLLRKKSRALIDSAWAAGNFKTAPDDVAPARQRGRAAAKIDKKTDIDKKIEEIAARRSRRRALKI